MFKKRVTTLKRSKENRGLSKLKIDKSKSIMKNMEKIVNFFGKDLKNITSEEIEKHLRFTNFNVELELVGEQNLQEKLRTFSQEEDLFYVARITDLKGNKLEVFTTKRLKSIKQSYNLNVYYRVIPGEPNKRIRVLDISYIYGYLKMLDICYQEVSHNKDYFFSEEFNNVCLFETNNKYTNIEIDDIVTLVNIQQSLKFREGERLSTFILNVLCLMQMIDISQDLTEKYEKNKSSECARAFETKKNIPNKIKEVMEHTILLKDFKYVELDEDVDIDKFKLIEEEFIYIKNLLNLEKFTNLYKPELRVRKLGKHKAKGVFFPHRNCISIDLSYPDSFLHEFAHFIDYTLYEGTLLSLQTDFVPIIKNYTEAYEKYILLTDNNYLKRKRDYYKTPTEIFARCFEMYLSFKGINTSFNQLENNLLPDEGYPPISEEFKEEIIKYFSKLIDINDKFISTQNSSYEKKYNYEQIKFSI